MIDKMAGIRVIHFVDRRLKWRCVVAILACMACVSSVSAQTTRATKLSDDDLARLVNPSGDDWATEVRGDDAKHRLADLSKSLIEHGGLTADAAKELFSADARTVSIRPSGGKTISVGEFRVRRADSAGAGTTGLANVIREFVGLLEPHRGNRNLRMEMKVVGVEAGATRRFRRRLSSTRSRRRRAGGFNRTRVGT